MGRKTVAAGSFAVAGTAALLGSQVLWTARRPLPSLDQLDASGLVPGTEPAAPLRLVALGDSTLTGPGLAGPEDVWLHQALASLEPRPPIDLISLAVGGARAAGARALVTQALELDPDAVVVAVGSNDAIHGTPMRAFASTFEALVSGLLAGGTTIGVCNVGDLGNVARVPKPLNTILRRRSALVRRQIEAVVARHPDAILIDVSASNAGFQDRGVFAPDLFHPNRVGHGLWADAARPGLAKVVAAATSGSPPPPDRF